MRAPLPERSPTARPPGLWARVYLGLLAPLYVISPLALAALPGLRRLPRPAWAVLGMYALSQQIPALFAPDPGIASVLALLRTLLMGGLIGFGVRLGAARNLRLAAPGLALVCVIALGYSFLISPASSASRLSYPFMTANSLGLVGAAAIWMAASPGTWQGRLPLALVGGATLFLSGSRGALLAAVVGLLAALLGGGARRTLKVGVLGAALLALSVTSSLGGRLSSLDTTGRDLVWNNVLSVVQSDPLSGIGSYRLGTALAGPGPCLGFEDARGQARACPEWVEALGRPWLIAHNVSLQALAEAGPFGLAGLFMLLGAVVLATWQTREPLALAICTGMLAATITDNTLLVPSPFFAELFWIMAGTQLHHLPALGVRLGAVACGLLILLSAPVLSLLLPSPDQTRLTLKLLDAPPATTAGSTYSVALQLRGPPGPYRVALRSCRPACATIAVVQTAWSDLQQGVLLELSGSLYTVRRQRVEVLVYPGASGWRAAPLAARHWWVTSP